MRRAAVVRSILAFGLVGVLSTPARAAVGSVKCCLDAAVDDGPPRRTCIVLNVRARVRAKARARQLCRLAGGRPSVPAGW